MFMKSLLLLVLQVESVLNSALPIVQMLHYLIWKWVDLRSVGILRRMTGWSYGTVDFAIQILGETLIVQRRRNGFFLSHFVYFIKVQKSVLNWRLFLLKDVVAWVLPHFTFLAIHWCRIGHLLGRFLRIMIDRFVSRNLTRDSITKHVLNQSKISIQGWVISLVGLLIEVLFLGFIHEKAWRSW